MKLKSLLLIFAFITVSATVAQETVTLYGVVKDKNNQPVDSASVWLKNRVDNIEVKNKRLLFENAYETLTDKNGRFSIEVEKGTYYCLYAIKESDYGKTKLEYWAWNLPIYDDLEINPEYDSQGRSAAVSCLFSIYTKFTPESSSCPVQDDVNCIRV